MTTDDRTTESKPSPFERQAGMAITAVAVIALSGTAVLALSHYATPWL